MTLFLLRSQMPDPAAFDAAVAAHVRELSAYEKHKALVAAGNADPYPAPMAPAVVDAAVKRTEVDGVTVFEPNYSVVDRFPVPQGDADALDRRKAELHAEVTAQESAAMNAIMTPRKRRLSELLHQAAIVKSPASRSADERDAIERHDAFTKKLMESQIHHARQIAAIDDLGFDDVDTWKPEPFVGS